MSSEPELIEWEYGRRKCFTKHLFYWLIGGVEPVSMDRTPNLYLPGRVGRYVPDSRVPMGEDGGALEEITIEDVPTIQCTECKKTLSREIQGLSVDFQFHTDCSEDFVGNGDCACYTICNERVRSTIVDEELSGARFLSQRHVKEECVNQDYYLVLGSTSLPRAQSLPKNGTCKECGEHHAFLCPKCRRLQLSCRRCGHEVRYKFRGRAEDVDVGLDVFDLDGWNGDDLVVEGTSDCLLASGRLIATLLDRGHTSFSFGPVRCEYDSSQLDIVSRVNELSLALF